MWIEALPDFYMTMEVSNCHIDTGDWQGGTFCAINSKREELENTEAKIKILGEPAK